MVPSAQIMTVLYPGLTSLPLPPEDLLSERKAYRVETLRSILLEKLFPSGGRSLSLGKASGISVQLGLQRPILPLAKQIHGPNRWHFCRKITCSTCLLEKWVYVMNRWSAQLKWDRILPETLVQVITSLEMTEPHSIVVYCPETLPENENKRQNWSVVTVYFPFPIFILTSLISSILPKQGDLQDAEIKKKKES